MRFIPKIRFGRKQEMNEGQQILEVKKRQPNILLEVVDSLATLFAFTAVFLVTFKYLVSFVSSSQKVISIASNSSMADKLAVTYTSIYAAFALIAMLSTFYLGIKFIIKRTKRIMKMQRILDARKKIEKIRARRAEQIGGQNDISRRGTQTESIQDRTGYTVPVSDVYQDEPQY